MLKVFVVFVVDMIFNLRVSTTIFLLYTNSCLECSFLSVNELLDVELDPVIC